MCLIQNTALYRAAAIRQSKFTITHAQIRKHTNTYMRIHKYKYTIHTFTEIARWVASMWLIRNLAMYRAPASIGLSRPLFILPTVKPRLITHPPYIYKPEKHQSLYAETCSTFSFLIHSWWNISNTHQSHNNSSCLSDREWLTRFWSAQSLHLTFWDLRYTTVPCFSDVPPFLWSTTDIPLHCFFWAWALLEEEMRQINRLLFFCQNVNIYFQHFT